MGAKVQRHPTRAQPYEGGCKRSSSSIHGCPGTTNRIPVHGRGAALPSPSKVQDAANRNIRRSEQSRRPPQHLQEPYGPTWIPRPRVVQSLHHHTKRPSTGLVQQTSALFNLIFQGALHRFVSHFIRARTYRKSTYHLLTIKKNPHENLRSYVQRFNAESLKVDIPN